MPGGLAQVEIAVIGGDRRQSSVAETLARQAAAVRVFAVPAVEKRPDLVRSASLADALTGAALVLLPITGANPAGRVATMPGQPEVRLDDVFWAALTPGALILTGSLPPEGKRRAAAGNHRVIEYAEIDEIAILNAIPTAEGALQLAMEGLPITIHGSCVFVLGLGRVGLTVARLFRAVGAGTWVVANRPALRARAVEMGCGALTFAELPDEAERADLIVNTVPALVMPGALLARTKPAVYIIDLASAPGGVDFQAAESLGRRAVLASGLPGRVAPESAARILSATLPAIIERELAQEPDV